MATTTVTSKRFTLNLSDGMKAFIVAVGTPVLYLLQEMIPGWNVSPLLKAAIAATVTYLLKNFFTASAVVVKDVPNTTVDAVKSGDAKVNIQ